MKKLFGVVTFWLALEYFVLGPFSYFPVYEWGDGVFPYHVNLFRDLITYGFSYWSRHFASGADYLAQGLSHTQAHGLLYLTLPTWLVTPVIFALRFFLSGYFTYRIAADHLELSKHGALFAGIAFSLFHLSFSTSPFSFSALPCLLWILDLILKKGGENARRWPAVVFAAVIYSLFESTSGSFPFVLPFILLWLIVLRKRRSVQDFGLLILFCLLLIALQTPTIWGLLAYAKGSHRIHGFPTETSRLFYPWENLASFKNYVMSFASPFFHSANRFDHALLLPLTLLAVFSHMLKNKKLNFVFFCLLLTTLGNMIFHTLTLAFYEHLGPFKGFHFKRFYYMTHLFYPLCAAFAFEKLPKRFHLKSGVVFLSFLMLFYSSLLYKKEHLSFWLDGASYTYVYDNQELKKLKTILGESESPFRVATVSDNHPETFMEPSLVNVYGLESADGYLNMYPKRYQEFWLNVIEPLKGQYAYFDIFKKWGNKIYLFLPEDRERYFLRKFSDYFRLNLLSLANVKYIISSPVAPIEDPNLVLIAKPDYPIPQRKDLALPTRLKKTFL